jgi:ABC-type sugar transport system ATPase subunit
MSENLTDIPLLKLKNVKKSYSGVSVINDISLSLFAGEIHALVGENGAGKSTLIKILSGSVKADSVSCEVDGVPINIESVGLAEKLSIRFIHQELNAIPHLSVAEFIFLGKKLPRRLKFLVDWKNLNNNAQTVLKKFGVDHINPKKAVGRLSIGDKILVKLCGAFVAEDYKKEARLYVLDEPTASLNSTEVSRLFSILRRLASDGRAILYVSHRINEIFELTNRVTVLRDGEVVLKKLIRHLSVSDLLKAMTGRQVLQTFPKRQTYLSNEIVLQAKNLRNNRLKNISFVAKCGEVLGIAGLNGSGRSELLRALMGCDSLDTGQVFVNGKSIKPSISNMWNTGFAYIPEERRSQGLVMNQTVTTNTALPFIRQCSLFNIFANSSVLRRKTKETTTSVKLRTLGLNQRVWQLSGGNQQKILFARSLWSEPRILLLDEPTRGVDVGAKQEIYEVVRSVSDQGTSVLMVSSELRELIGLCDKILVLKKGELLDIVDTLDLTEQKLLSSCYGQLK